VAHGCGRAARACAPQVHSRGQAETSICGWSSRSQQPRPRSRDVILLPAIAHELPFQPISHTRCTTTLHQAISKFSFMPQHGGSARATSTKGHVPLNPPDMTSAPAAVMRRSLLEQHRETRARWQQAAEDTRGVSQPRGTTSSSRQSKDDTRRAYGHVVGTLEHAARRLPRWTSYGVPRHKSLSFSAERGLQ